MEPDWIGQVEGVAPQLLSLTHLSSTSPFWGFSQLDYIAKTLQSLREVKTGSLGLVGYKLDEILNTLQPLQHLQHLSISNSTAPGDYHPFDQMTSIAALSFLSSAPSIRSLTLPLQLKDHWKPKEIKDVENAADARRVVFQLA